LDLSARLHGSARCLLLPAHYLNGGRLMGERELMKLRELKEAAHALFARGRYAQCSETYERILRLAPKDPNVRVRHAESCRRAGDRQSAIASYRVAAELLMEQGCESRARGALRAALELDPKDPMILADLARMGQQAQPSTALEDEKLYSGTTGVFERPGAVPAPPRAPQGYVPPPPPPQYVLRAAEETPVPGPLPAVVPTIAPVNLDALRSAGRTVAPIPSTRPAGPGPAQYRPPSVVPVIQGRLITQPPVPPNLPPARTGARSAAARPEGATAPAPARPAGAAPRGVAVQGQAGSLTMVPVAQGGDAREAVPATPYRPELRRLGPNAVALRVSPHARWVIIRSDSPLEVSRAETLPVPAAEPQHGAAYASEQHSGNPASVTH
jgi:hypothetical protein